MGSNPQPPDHQLDHPTKPPRPASENDLAMLECMLRKEGHAKFDDSRSHSLKLKYR